MNLYIKSHSLQKSRCYGNTKCYSSKQTKGKKKKRKKLEGEKEKRINWKLIENENEKKCDGVEKWKD